jgi:hypothetical protein
MIGSLVFDRVAADRGLGYSFVGTSIRTSFIQSPIKCASRFRARRDPIRY